jgi:AcrR family transcriptional regulator
MTTGTGTKRWKRLDTDERRSQILDVAQRLFSQRPYGQVSTAEIAEAAGVTRGLVHHYFGTKRELYLETVRELVRLPIGELFDSMVAHSTGGRVLSWEESVDAWMNLVEQNREAWLAAIDAGETGQDRAMQEILYEVRDRTASQVMLVLGLDAEHHPAIRSLVLAYGRFAEEITREWLDRRRISRGQARSFLTGSLPLMVEHLVAGSKAG